MPGQKKILSTRAGMAAAAGLQTDAPFCSNPRACGLQVDGPVWPWLILQPLAQGRPSANGGRQRIAKTIKS